MENDDTMIAPAVDGGSPELNAGETKQQETFTKPTRDGKISYIEREVDRFDFDGYEVVRRELFSKVNCPAVTLKYGSVAFNVRAIRKLDECSHIQILINSEKKLMIAKPCAEEDKDSVQWSRVDKREKVVTRQVTGKYFTGQLFKDMGWNLEATFKVLGTMLTCREEKIFVFDLINAEAYMRISAPTADDPKRRQRIPLQPEHWQGHYGDAYNESQDPIVKTFEGVPEGFVKITLPPVPARMPAVEKVETDGNKTEEVTDGTEQQ